MSKHDLSAKDVAARLNMTPKNFRKRLRDKELAFVHKDTRRYHFTEKEAADVIDALTQRRATDSGSGATVNISEFKAKCLGLIDQVYKTRQPLRITRHGRPVAELIPAGPDRKRKFLGDMAGTVEILGDIVSPVIDLDEFEAYRD